MADLTQNTILRFKCDESTGTTVYDSSGNAIHKALIGNIPRTSQNIYSFANEEGYTLSGSTRIPKLNNSNTLDVFGNQLTYKGKVSYPAEFVESNALSFDTIDDYAEFPNPYSFLRTNGFTTDLPVSIFARVMFKENGSDVIVLGASENVASSADSDFVVYTDSATNKLRFSIYSAKASSSNPNRISVYQASLIPTLNRYYNIVITYNGNRDSTSVTYYVDGISTSVDLYTFIGVGHYTGKTQALRSTWQVSKFGSINFSSKEISALSIYNSVLTAQEALNLHNGIFTKPAVVFFPFSEGIGNNTYTTSGSIITGATLFGGVTRSKQDIYPYNQLNNHWQYVSGNTSGQTVTLYSPIDLTNSVPTGFTFSRFVQGSRYYLNGSESKVNFNYYNAPKTNLLPTGYTQQTSPSSFLFYRNILVSSGTSEFLLYPVINNVKIVNKIANYSRLTNITDSDVLNVISIMTGLTKNEQYGLNYLITYLKLTNLWNKLKAIYPFIGRTSANHKFNIKNPLDTNGAFRLTFSGGVTHNENGVTFDGINGYANTYFTPTAQLTQNSESIIYYSRSSGVGAAGVQDDIGTATSIIIRSGMIVRNDVGNFVSQMNSVTNGLTSVSNPDGKGIYVSSRISSTSGKLFKNKKEVASNINANNGTLGNSNHYIGCRNVSNVAQSFTPRNTGFVALGDGLSDIEAINLSNIIEITQVILNRNV
jgi:hypothetical protein